jgi:hypothetical protein
MPVSMPLGTFYSRNIAILRELFVLLNAPWSSADNRANANTAMQMWLGGEHGQSNVSYTHDQLDQAMPLFERMGLIGAVIPESPTSVDQLWLIGGTTTANIKRWQLMRQLEADQFQLGSIIGWFGQRLRETRDGSVSDIVERLVTAHGPKILKHQWVDAQMALDDRDPNRWRRPFASELEVGIMSALLVFGPDLVRRHQSRTTETSVIPDVPNRMHAFEIWRRPDASDLIMLNAAAQVRIMAGRPAQPRHTTASCAEESLLLFPPSLSSRVMVMSGNPHTERTIFDTNKVVLSQGRSDLKLVVVGTVEANTAILPITCLGEVARMLKNELLD